LENITVKCDEAADGHDAPESCPGTETYDDRCRGGYREICPTRELGADGGEFYLASGHVCEEMKGSPFPPLFLLQLLNLQYRRHVLFKESAECCSGGVHLVGSFCE
jgi:hypothetical protein